MLSESEGTLPAEGLRTASVSTSGWEKRERGGVGKRVRVLRQCTNLLGVSWAEWYLTPMLSFLGHLHKPNGICKTA